MHFLSLLAEETYSYRYCIAIPIKKRRKFSLVEKNGKMTCVMKENRKNEREPKTLSKILVSGAAAC